MAQIRDVVAIGFVLGLLASRPSEATSQGRGVRPIEGPQLLLYDAFTLQEGLEITLRGVIVRTEAGFDTVPGVLTQDTPVLVGDSIVLGFTCDSVGQLSHAFRYSVARKAVEFFPAPSDAQAGLSSLTFSPDGTKVAYVSFGNGNGIALIRSWPDGHVVLQSTPQPVYGTDATAGVVGWQDGTRVHFLILIPPLTPSPNRWWSHVRADLRQRRLFVDTLVTAGPQ